MSAVLQQTTYTPEQVHAQVHEELRDFRHENNEKFQVMQSQLDVISNLTITHVRECDARKPDMDILLKEARDQKAWREINSRKLGKVKTAAIYTFSIVTGVSTLIASCIYIIGVFSG